MKILVIEDNPELIKSVCLCVEFTSLGGTSLFLWEGRRGGELVETESPDLVVLDIASPAFHGLEVLREIRRFSDVPVVVLAPGHDEADKVKALEMGADDYFVKPFTAIELMARIGAMLRRAQPSQLSARPSAPLRVGSPIINRFVQGRYYLHG